MFSDVIVTSCFFNVFFNISLKKMFLNKILSKFLLQLSIFFCYRRSGRRRELGKKDERQQVLVGKGFSISR